MIGPDRHCPTCDGWGCIAEEDYRMNQATGYPQRVWVQVDCPACDGTNFKGELPNFIQHPTRAEQAKRRQERRQFLELADRLVAKVLADYRDKRNTDQ